MYTVQRGICKTFAEGYHRKRDNKIGIKTNYHGTNVRKDRIEHSHTKTAKHIGTNSNENTSRSEKQKYEIICNTDAYT